jgi:hypothetical protein
MIDTLVYLLILCVIFGVIYYVLTLLPLPAPFGLIVQVILALVMVLFLLDILLGGRWVGLGPPRRLP